MDLAIYVVGGIVAIFAIGVAAVSAFSMKHKGTYVLWLSFLGVVFILLGITLYLQKRIWEHDEAIATGAAKSAAQTPVAKERPELFLEKAEIQPLEPGKPEFVLLVVKNRGKATARNVGIENHITLVNTPFNSPLRYLGNPELETRTDVAANAGIMLRSQIKRALTEEWVNNLQSGKMLLFYFGKGEYEDDSGNKYPIKYCYMYDPMMPTSMRICPTRYWPEDDTPAMPVADRPYIGIKQMVLVAPLTVGQYPTIRIIFVNGGKTPAAGFVSYARLILSTKSIAEAMKDFPLEEFKSAENGSLLTPGMERRVEFPQMNLTITIERLSAINTRAVKLYVVGEARYRDIQGRELVLPIRAVYDPSEGGFEEAD